MTSTSHERPAVDGAVAAAGRADTTPPMHADRASVDDATSAPSNLAIFRMAAILVALAAGLYVPVMLWHLGPDALAHQRNPPLVPMAVALAGGVASQGVLDVVIASCLAGLVAFVACVVRLTSARRPTPRVLVACLALQLLLGLAISQRWLFVVAAQWALLLPWRHAWRAWLAQGAAYAVARVLGVTMVRSTLLTCGLVGAPLPPLPTSSRLLAATAVDVALALMFQALAFGVGALARLEQRRREDLAATHRALLATRQLVGASAAAQERLRVARELHDSIGHHLTAMTLHIDLAIRQGGATAALTDAAGLARALLAEVRGVVASERGTGAAR